MSALAVLPISTLRPMDEVVAAAQAGDMAAFEQLYRTHAPRVFALCLRLCGSEELARALTQDAFVRAWDKLAGFRGDAAFSTWLHRLTVNLVLRDRRTRLRRARREHEAARSEQAEEVHGRIDASVDLERAIASLPRRARTVFVLHEIEGYRHQEIAELMGLAPGTSKAQLHRARQLLRRSLR